MPTPPTPLDFARFAIRLTNLTAEHSVSEEYGVKITWSIPPAPPEDPHQEPAALRGEAIYQINPSLSLGHHVPIPGLPSIVSAALDDDRLMALLELAIYRVVAATTYALLEMATKDIAKMIGGAAQSELVRAAPTPNRAQRRELARMAGGGPVVK